MALLVSGSGRSLENLAELGARGELPFEIALVLSDRGESGALERCARLGIPALVLPYKELGGAAGFSQRVFAELDQRGVKLCVLAGFLRLLAVPAHWTGRVINIHPSLLPAFGGKGMYGERVHAAVLAAGVAETGCTVHFVDEHYDHGAPILQRRVPVLSGDDAHTLAERVFAEEKRALPEAIRTVLARLANPRPG
ncbi:MAG: phosphoribosylglycinamide formyltransferase [Planctomycetes bacterium]|nr:phosphoribosylglycinamide formyltransferase [Planctomycetota bacterium]